MDAFSKGFFCHDLVSVYRVDGVAGRTVQDVYADDFIGVVITFTDGSHLLVAEVSQTGELNITMQED